LLPGAPRGVILIIGAGPIIIGQACEFDYSGVQACKALRAEGYRIVLVNSNPATIMTDPDVADATYIEPITPEMVEKIIAKERPDALLPTMGGQTALNTALALEASGVLAKYGVEMIGAKADVIDKAEDRQKFRDAMDKLGLESPKSKAAHSMDEALEGLEFVGLPAIIRPSFTLAGTGGGIAYNVEEFREIVERGLDLSPTTEVLIEESVLGWKEYEMEVVRDKADNCIIVCSIENIDPMGVHTGDSITVAPALTLTDKEYQIMRAASIAVLREIGVETGGSNVQFAVNPADGRMVVIEMNPRVSRSSALASKATGFPIAKVAARLAVGYTLDELMNDITGGDAGLLRAQHRLCRDQDPPLRLREVSGLRAPPDHRHEVGWRGHGHRPHLRREPAEGAARPGGRCGRPERKNPGPRSPRKGAGRTGAGAYLVRRRCLCTGHDRRRGP
jgi:carbamoyl-phosphate synthase large subunit